MRAEEASRTTMQVNTVGYATGEDDDIRTISPNDAMSSNERFGGASFVAPRSIPADTASDRPPRSSSFAAAGDPSVIHNDDATHDHHYYPKSIATSYEHRDQLSYSGAASFVYAAGNASFCDFDAASTDAAIQRGTDMAYDEVVSVMGHTIAHTIATKYTHPGYDDEEHRYHQGDTPSRPIPVLPNKGTDLTDSIIGAMDYDTDYRRTASNPSIVKSTDASKVLLQRRRMMMMCFIVFLVILIVGAVATGVICTLGTSCTASSFPSKSSSLDSSPGTSSSSSSLEPTRAPVILTVETPTVPPTMIQQRSPEPSVAPSIFVPPPTTKRPSMSPTRSPNKPDNPQETPTDSPVEPRDPTTEAPQEPPTDPPQEPTTDRPEAPTTRHPSPAPSAADNNGGPNNPQQPSPQETVEPTMQETATPEPTPFGRRPSNNGPPTDDDQ